MWQHSITKISTTFTSLALLCLVSAVTQTASAQPQAWIINEIFSSADGSVQFIELATSAADQGALSGVTLTSENLDLELQELEFVGDLTGDTSNTTVLIATEGFATLTGLDPDYLMPANFIPTAGGSLDFGNSVDVLSYTREQLPLNGVQSIDGDQSPQMASPTRFDGMGSTTLSAETYSTVDQQALVMNVPVLNAPGIGIGNVSFDIDLVALEFTLREGFYLYQSGITAGDNAAQFENSNSLTIPGVIFGNELYEFKLAILGDNPIRFGNPTDIVVTNLDPGPEPEPEPDPELQASIDRGQTTFASVCSLCHGVSGGGGIGPNLRTSSLDTFDVLRNFIDANMPQGNPASCRDTESSSCATDAANYVLYELQQ